jgi:hypothetical protein
MKTNKFIILIGIFSILLFFISCIEADKDVSAFNYDEAVFTNAKPWTSENFKNNPDNFQFVIIGDRTGGANAQGTFRLAMDQINLLQPEFVINVGDLIEGYPEDRADLNGMWDEADSLLDMLEMPFFRTIGNHDVSTSETKEVWMERHGADYYHFVYQDVLFMVINSEDGSRPAPPPEIKEGLKVYNRLQIEDPEAASKMLEEFMTSEAVIAALGQPVEFPDKQMNWIKNTLEKNKNVRWTFFFMHEPCWENPSESFKAIQEVVKERKHTMIAGHLHYYDYDFIDGFEYITIGPAGASFHHDGPGNVDHIMWVTMTDDGPQIANIALKGLFDRKGLDPELFGAYDRKGY